MQPNYATLIFAWYGEQPTPFTADPGLIARAKRLATDFRAVLGMSPEDVLFIGRIGEPVSTSSRGRSVRRPSIDLMRPAAAESGSGP